MVDGSLLATDIVATTVYLVTPPLLWMALFFLAWGDEAKARESGFGRRTFWLLLPGALFGMVSNLVFFAWTRDFLAINIGGGLLPLVLSVLLVARVLGDRARLLTVFLIAFAVESYFGLAAVFLLPDGPVLELTVGGFAVASCAVMWALVRTRRDPTERGTFRNATLLLGLSSVALVPTFASTATVPGLGIVSEFPWYLLPPVLVGVLAVLSAGPLFGISRRASLGLAYAASTFGVLIGADLLREPPLYGSTLARLYAIGGAGTGDLLYLSGLIALASGLVVLRLIGPGSAPPPIVPTWVGGQDPTLGPGALLRRSLIAAVEGQLAPSVRDANAAVEGAIGQAHQVLAGERGTAPGAASAFPGAPAWLEADRTNLAALALSPVLHPADATRAWMTARWIVRSVRAASRRAYGSFLLRAAAFLLDLTLLTVPAAFLWYYVVSTTSGSLLDLLGSVPVNAALFAYTSLGLVYFVLTEAATARTFGKWVLGLRVRVREPGPPGPRAVLLRNLPKLAPLTVIGIFSILAIILEVHAVTASVSLPGGIAVTVDAVLPVIADLAIALAILAGLSALVIHYTPERQRFGDVLADTWVVRARSTSAGAAPPASSAPSGAARSG